MKKLLIALLLIVLIFVPALELKAQQNEVRPGKTKNLNREDVKSKVNSKVWLIDSQIPLANSLANAATGSGAISLVLGSNQNLIVHDNMEIVISGDLKFNGVFKPANGMVTLTGSGNQLVSNAGGEGITNLTVNKPSGDVQLAGNISVNGNLTLTSGDLDLNGNIADLGTTGMLIESASGRVKGASGDIRATRDLNAPSALNVAGLGAEITSSANLGITEIRRGHSPQLGNGNAGIERYYDITPTNNSGLNATLVFNYNDSELNGLSEVGLALFRSTDGGTSWNVKNGMANTTENTITLAGIGSFSRWTAANAIDSPLPVELSSFAADVQGNKVILTWTTQSELNNTGFEVYRSRNENGVYDMIASYKQIPALQGEGNSSTSRNYTYEDNPGFNGETILYKIADIALDGVRTFHGPISVESPVLLPEKLTLHQNYPNPFNPSTNIRFEVPIDYLGSEVRLIIYNTLGMEVRTLVRGVVEPGIHTLKWDGRNNHGQQMASGIYFLRIQTKNINLTRKLQLLR